MTTETKALVERLKRQLDKYEDGDMDSSAFAGQVRHDLRALLAHVEALEGDKGRLDWMEMQTRPHHGVILCGLDILGEEFASVQRVDQFHNPHKVEWCHEGRALRDAIDAARTPTETINDE